MKKIIFIIILLLTPVITQADGPTIVINEIAWMGNENSSNDEWIELYNNTDEEIDLTGWKLTAQDGSPDIELTGTIAPEGFFILERTDDDSAPDVVANQIYSGSLGNSGEYLKLINTAEELIDKIDASEAWPGGDNTTKQTLERIDEANWQTSLDSGGTPKQTNSINPDQPEDTEDENDEEENSEEENLANNSTANTATAPAKKGDIVISEILPNPEGNDLKEEFIELENVSNRSIDITNWKLTNSSKQEYIITSWQLQPGSIITIYRAKSNLALNNTKETVFLYTADNKLINRLEYKNAPAGKSLQIDRVEKIWNNPTPNVKTIIEPVVLLQADIQGPTKAEIGQIISFDGSDSFDPAKRELKYLWTFGDGRQAQGVTAKQLYIKEGKYDILLTAYVNDLASSTDKLTITITNPNNDTPTKEPEIVTPTTTEQLLNFDKIPFIFISEFLPNPTGSDTEDEFIELFNNEGTIIDLTGWQLDDEDGGSKPYIFKNEIIKPGQYLALYRKQTKLALNNDADTIQLIAPDHRIADLVTYEESSEGVSYVLDENFIWLKSSTPTPGEINVLNDLNKQNEIKDNAEANPDQKVLGVKQENPDPQPKTNKNKYIAVGASALFIFGLGAIKNLKKSK